MSIQDTLLKLIKNRISIGAAYILPTIQNLDKIIGLRKGVVKEMGSHQKLLEKEGMYYDLYRLQF